MGKRPNLAAVCVIAMGSMACADGGRVADPAGDHGPGGDAALTDDGSAPGDERHAGDPGSDPMFGDPATGDGWVAGCPPSGPFGNGVGETVAQVTLFDCEGNPHRLHDLCAAPAAWVFVFAGW